MAETRRTPAEDGFHRSLVIDPVRIAIRIVESHEVVGAVEDSDVLLFTVPT